jgi:oligopeptide transport system substrate-binding protein
MFRHRIRAVLYIGATLALAGCGNDPNPKPFAEKREDGTPWRVLYYYLPDEVRSLDPQVSYDQISRRVIEPVQETLLEYHPMKTDPYEVMPGLLASMPEKTANPDGSVSYLCKLKPNVLYHDDPCFPQGKGREVVAEDVHFAFQRLSDPAVESPVFLALADFVAGMKEVFEAAKKAGKFDYDAMRVRGIEVVDRHTFKVHVVKPYPQIIYWLAMHFTAPVAKEATLYYDGKEHPDGPNGRLVVRKLFKFHPVGNGPFMIKEWIPNQRFRLVRNPNYHTTVFPSDGWEPERESLLRPLAGQKLPFVDEIQLTIFRELLPIWVLTRQGYMDHYGVMGKDVVSSIVNTSKELSPKFTERGMQLGKTIDVSTFWLNLNMQDPIIGTNKKLRQALSCAYDPRGFIDLLYGGVAPVAEQFLSPGIYGYQKDFKNPYGPNLERAKQLLAEAGYPNGIDPATGQPLVLTMDVTATGAEERQLAEYDQRQFQQLGIKMQMIENTFARKLEKEDQGNYQIVETGWGADYPDPENYFFLFYSKNIPPSGKNVSRYKNEEFDRLYDQMVTMENSPERLKIVHRMNDILLDDCAMILRFHKAYYVVVQPWAPQIHHNRMLEVGLKYFVSDPVLRAEKQKEWNTRPAWPIAALGGVLAIGAIYAVQINRKRNV